MSTGKRLISIERPKSIEKDKKIHGKIDQKLLEKQ